LIAGAINPGKGRRGGLKTIIWESLSKGKTQILTSFDKRWEKLDSFKGGMERKNNGLTYDLHD